VWRKLTLVAIAALFVGLVADRVRRSIAAPNTGVDVEMPQGVGDDEALELHLKPGGKYTQADIEANGRTTPSKKYRGFKARHDFAPQSGDRLCPVTRTKANAGCTWIVGGRTYQFCCPPCIDEFVELAKRHPDRLLPPKAYTK
jgi:hypothetical protein